LVEKEAVDWRQRIALATGMLDVQLMMLLLLLLVMMMTMIVLRHRDVIAQLPFHCHPGSI